MVKKTMVANKSRKGPAFRRNDKGRPRAMNNAPVSRGVPSRNAAAQRYLRKSGCDYINVVEGSTFADGSIIYEIIVNPEAMPQMKKVGASYQKIKYRQLQFEVSSHMPTTSSGGYIMAYRPDPADELPADILERKRMAVSTPNSVKDSIWQSRTLTVTNAGGLNPSGCLPPGYLFTSPSAEIRQFSPGVFWMIVDGAVNTAGNFSLSIHWDVEFHVESYEPEVSDSAGFDLRTKTLAYLYDGKNQVLSGDTATSTPHTWASYISDDIPKPVVNVFLRMPVTYGVTRATEASEDIEWSNVFIYYVEPDTFGICSAGGAHGASVNAKSPTGNTQVLSDGMRLDTEEVPGAKIVPNSIQSSSRLNSAREHYSRLPSGGLSNRACLVTSKRPFNPWI